MHATLLKLYYKGQQFAGLGGAPLIPLLEGRDGLISEFKASLVSRANSTTAMVTQGNSVLKKKIKPFKMF